MSKKAGTQPKTRKAKTTTPSKRPGKTKARTTPIPTGAGSPQPADGTVPDSDSASKKLLHMAEPETPQWMREYHAYNRLVRFVRELPNGDLLRVARQIIETLRRRIRDGKPDDLCRMAAEIMACFVKKRTDAITPAWLFEASKTTAFKERWLELKPKGKRGGNRQAAFTHVEGCAREFEERAEYLIEKFNHGLT